MWQGSVTEVRIAARPDKERNILKWGKDATLPPPRSVCGVFRIYVPSATTRPVVSRVLSLMTTV